MNGVDFGDSIARSRQRSLTTSSIHLLRKLCRAFMISSLDSVTCG